MNGEAILVLQDGLVRQHPLHPFGLIVALFLLSLFPVVFISYLYASFRSTVFHEFRSSAFEILRLGTPPGSSNYCPILYVRTKSQLMSFKEARYYILKRLPHLNWPRRSTYPEYQTSTSLTCWYLGPPFATSPPTHICVTQPTNLPIISAWSSLFLAREQCRLQIYSAGSH